MSEIFGYRFLDQSTGRETNICKKCFWKYGVGSENLQSKEPITREFKQQFSCKRCKKLFPDKLFR